MIEQTAESLDFVSFDGRRLYRQILSHTVPGAAALAFSALVSGWILHALPDNTPKAAKTPPVSSRVLAPAQVVVSNPYGALINPGFSFGPKPSSLAEGFSSQPSLKPVPPIRSAEIEGQQTAAPAAGPAASPLVESTPLPPPRPSIMESPNSIPVPPAESPAPIRHFAQQTGKALPSVPTDNRNFFQKLLGIGQPSSPALAYASATGIGGGRGEVAGMSGVGALRCDASSASGIGTMRGDGSGSAAGYDRFTAIYDLAAHTVTLPDGRRLEAHSGLGDRLDDPHHVNERNRGATPPHVYELEAREQLFHGVQALRLNPVGGGEIFGRAGLLAHSYMLGPNGDSNGCVSFRDYDAFLKAYQSGQVKRLAVVAGT
jgi:Protein of unknown function (DUF2778)